MREYIEGYMDDAETRRFIALRLAIDAERPKDYVARDVVGAARTFEEYLKGDTDLVKREPF